MINDSAIEKSYPQEGVKGLNDKRHYQKSVVLSTEEKECFDKVYSALDAPALTLGIAFIMQLCFYGGIVMVGLLLAGFLPSLEKYVGNL